ncbi:MAG TPA: thymidine phosphorylase, partial [Bacteroidetes bacterium]|nr:thymidine phosphorylase [Bacteroidota bacterium]
GTLDKLETIPGFSTALGAEKLARQVERIGLAFGAQTGEIVPADKRIYALRDVTSTVRSLPLITSSIISKKVAEGTKALVFDVKCGDGAFMETEEDAVELARWLVRVGARFKLRTAALITSMSQPIGGAVGNWVEVAESLRSLRNEAVPEDVRRLTLDLGGTLLYLASIVETPDEGVKKLKQLWEEGAGFSRFLEAVEAQGGDPAPLRDGTELHPPACRLPVPAPRSGYLRSLRARDIGYASILLGAGRPRAEDGIDPAAGILIHAKVGEAVEEGQPILELLAKDEKTCREALGRVQQAIEIGDAPPPPEPLIRKVITTAGEHRWEDYSREGEGG